NMKYYEIREEFQPLAFLPIAQIPEPGADATFVLRTSAPPQEVFRGAAAGIAEVNPAFGVQFTIFSQQINESLMRDRLMAALAGTFGGLACLLAVLGLYGVIAYMVTRRRNEIGLRIALGASRPRVIRLVLKEAGLLLIAGLILGVGLSLWAGRAAA